MADEDGNTKRKGGAKGARGKASPEGWVENQIRQLYNDVADEPLPKDLLDLLDNIDFGDTPDESPDGGKR
ncbi:MAG: NepR family anti-sigma factor [Zavarzinia sp.]|nr:NepR family anti-sigma factor [Zavarzinia sp.]